MISILFYFLNVIYSCNGKAKFSVVLHDPSEIILICWFGAQETFLIIMLSFLIFLNFFYFFYFFKKT